VRLEQSFEVDAPIEQVWAALLDLERVAPCLPGASITGHDEDGVYQGTFQVKLGPTTASYRGTIRIESSDADSHTATLAAKGADKRGQGGASATIVNTLHESGTRTRVEAVTDFTITGRLASFGRGGMINDIANRLLRDFAACLQQTLGAGDGVEEAKSPAELAGKSPAEVAGEAPMEVAGKSPAEVAGETPGEVAGKSPAEVADEAPGDVAGKSPTEVSDEGTAATPPAPPAPAVPTQTGPAQPPAAAAPPVKGFSLLAGVLRDRLKTGIEQLRRRVRERRRR
jgi:uncharacterized protein